MPTIAEDHPLNTPPSEDLIGDRNHFKDRKYSEKLLTELHNRGFSKKGVNKEYIKAGGATGAGAVVGALKGGSIGIATSGVAVGVPVVVVGAVAGLAIYGIYKAFKNPDKKK